MGLMDELKRLARPYEDDDDYEEEDAKPTPTPIEKGRKSTPSDADYTRAGSSASSVTAPPRSVSTSSADTTGRKVVNMNMTVNTTTQLKVVLVRPQKFEDASEIADHLRDRRTVVLNLEDTENDVARRLVDFLSGVAYAQEGKIKKAAVSTYIITPYNVDIIAEHDILDELESNGVYPFK